MLLEAEGIVSGYGGLEVLHGVSLAVDTGKVVSLIGPNGCGKSTLMNAIFGFLPVKKGVVRFEGEDITHLKPNAKIKRGIGYVFQRRSVFPNMTVRENLEMGGYVLKNRAEIEKSIQSVFELYPTLKAKQNQMAYTMSGGEQRMLELGRALVTNPRLVILDEPSVGLSPLATMEIFERIQQMNKSGTAILIVEQNVKKALDICDYCYVFELGNNRFDGTPDDVLGNPELAKVYLPTGG